MPPKHDLRGGKASADSFAISSSVFITSTKRCFFATESRQVEDARMVRSLTELGLISASLAVGRRFLSRLDMVGSRLRDVAIGFVVVCSDVEAPAPRGDVLFVK